ncbi:MAG TPA: PLP-dependent aminotransferase family protein [Ktedonobacteraceae bacterium]|nr:PLP-dependent aminotransferase family protein [Ktedonobacteraceae bacterium]
MQWNSYFASRTEMMKRSAIRELLKLTTHPEVISFAGGLPAPELFPVDRIQQAANKVLSEHGPEALQYSTTEGMPELRSFLAQRLSNEVLNIKPENILIVTGSQQALDLIARVFVNEHDHVIVENPTYLGMLQTLRPYDLTYLPVPTDEDGMLIEFLPEFLRQQPQLMYVVPNYQNPKGTTLIKQRRLDLIQMLDAYPVPLIEDNPYSELCYTGEIQPTLMELDAQSLGSKELDGHVIYTSTFSKILSPGLRVGWIAAPLPVIDMLVAAKQGTDLHTSTLVQYIIYEVVRDGFLETHIPILRKTYRERRDIMLAAMEHYFPEEVSWTHPAGGLFLMVYMPHYLDAEELLKEALAYKVAFVPGVDFHVCNTGHNTFRLNFSHESPPMIEEGIKRLGQLLKHAIQQKAVSTLSLSR